MRYNAKIVMLTSWQGNGTVNIRKRIEQRMEQLGIYDIDEKNLNEILKVIGENIH